MLQAQNTNPVGAIPGAIDVSPMGATTYTIPIEVVPGTQGVQPNLSIVYNSMGGMGLLGMKWNLMGLSAITVCGQTPYYDNNITGIRLSQYSISDRFALDGNRLININGYYSANGTEYATEVENFIRVVSFGYHPQHSGVALKFVTTHLTVYTDDGNIIEYGHTDDSKQNLGSTDYSILSWYINKITDANGNYMTYSYGGANTGEIWINEIQYTGNATAGIATYAKVKFDYTTLPDTMGKNTYYIGSYAVPQTKLLTSITVYYGKDAVRKYEFSYNTNVSGERTAHLKEVVLKEYDANGAVKQLNPTTIEWGDANYSIESKTLTEAPTGQHLLTGDFNGDGYADIVTYTLNGLGNPGNTNVEYWKLYLYNPLENKYTYKTTGSYFITHDSFSFLARDINGDGKDELIMVTAKSQPVGISGGFIAYSIDNDPPVSVLFFDKLDFDRVLFGDLNGDGKDDIVIVTKVTEKKENIWTLTALNIGDIATIRTHKDDNLLMKVLDANGNGKHDILVYDTKNYEYDIYEYQEYSTSFKIISSGDYKSNSSFGDVNGDGITDVLTAKRENNRYNWKILMAKGDGSFSEYALPANALNQEEGDNHYAYRVVFADLNGDGKDDMIQPVYNHNTKKTTFNILLSNGWVNGAYKFTKKEKVVDGIYDDSNLRVVDFNGDGALDLFIQKNAETPKIIYVSKDQDYEFVTEIVDGMGKRMELAYNHKYLRAYSLPQKYYRKQFFSVAGTLKASNGIGLDLNTLQYQFDAPLFSVSRRMFLGFKKVVCENGQENKKEIHSFELENVNNASSSKQILIPTEHLISVNNNTINNTTYSYTLKDLPQNRFAPYYSSTTTKDFLSDTKTETTTTLNAVGRVETSNTKTYNACNAATNNWLHSETSTYTYDTIPLNGYQKKTVPKQILTTQQYGTNGTVIADTLTYHYDTTTGRLDWERQGNIHGCITTSYTNYTATGLCRQKTVSAAGCTSRTETYTYDNTQRFVTQIKNPLNHTTSFRYDFCTGNKLSETDINGLTTSYTYDVLGNLTQIVYPDGTQTNTSINWYSSSSIPNAKYQTTITSSGKPESIVYYDMLGRELCRKEDDLYSKTVYNDKGEVIKTMGLLSGPTFIEGEGIVCTFTYDIYGRKITETAPYTNLSYSYKNREVTVTDISRGVSSWKNYDALGRLIQAEDIGGQITYRHEITGSGNNLRHKTTISNDWEITTILSDLWGNRRSITEPNAGTITSEYNGFNELVKQVDARGNTTKYEYDLLGRVTQKQFTAPKETTQTTRYVYDFASTGKGKLYAIKLNDEWVERLTYDAKSRLRYHYKTIDGIQYTFSYSYNSNGQLQQLVYPGGFNVNYTYTSTGNLKEIRDLNGNLIYKVNLRNMFNAPKSCEYGNDVVTEYTYNANGLLTRINTGNKKPEIIVVQDKGKIPPEASYTVDSAILNYRYAYDNKGLMVSRSESVINRLETYEYDKLDRLTRITAGKIGEAGTRQTFSYYENGNISDNSQLGHYTYGNKPHAVSQIEPINNNVISHNQCDVTYNLFNQPARITEGDYQFDLFYGADQQRNKMIKSKKDKIIDSCYYLSKYFEIKKDASGARRYNYIYGDNGVVALYISTITPVIPDTTGGNGPIIKPDDQRGATIDGMYYIHTDHLGSYCTITNAKKQVVLRNRFDPWGNFISTSIKDDKGISPPPDEPQAYEAPPLTYRGFTGHEHYPELKIINMNGRLYDPVIGRFFSPDKFVQIPDFSQSFNRYSYCLNNPLHYTDPSGDNFVDMFFNIMAFPARLLTEGFTWLEDKMNGFSRPNGYFNWSYLAGRTEPGGYSAYSPINQVPYGHPLYTPPFAFAQFTGTKFGTSCLGADNGFHDMTNGFGTNLKAPPGRKKTPEALIAIACEALGISNGTPIPEALRNSGMVYFLKYTWFKYAPSPSGGIRITTLEPGNNGAVQPEDKDDKFTGGSIMYLDRERAFTSIERLFYTLAHELVHVSQFLNLKGQSTDIYDKNFRKAMDFYAYSYQFFIGDSDHYVNVNWSGISSDIRARINFANYAWTYLYFKPF